MRRGGSPGRRGFFDDVDLAAGYFSDGVDHFADTGTATRPQIVEITFLGSQRENVGAGQIKNVNVIANARPIRRFVIGAENRHLRFLPERDLSKHSG